MDSPFAERPHQALGNRPLSQQGDDADDVLPFAGEEVHCQERLGGLLKHYHRAAA